MKFQSVRTNNEIKNKSHFAAVAAAATATEALAAMASLAETHCTSSLSG
jgi:hypothetical protein